MVRNRYAIPVIVVNAKVLTKLFTKAIRQVFLAGPIMFVTNDVRVHDNVTVMINYRRRVRPLSCRITFTMFRQER